MSTAKIRILIVEDSATVRDRLRKTLTSDPELVIVGEATNGEQAIELCQRQRPDVITMDMVLPVLSGLAATEHIMAHRPTPILVVSSSTNRAELFDTYDALAAGAVDVLEKPHGDDSDNAWERRLLSTVKLVSRIRVITHPRARLNALNHQHATGSQTLAPATHHPPPAATDPPSAAPRIPRNRYDVVGIGASTGGPGAVVEVLRPLPRDYPIPVLLVQHISAPFATSFAEWLGMQLGVDVCHPTDGEPVAAAAGRVVLAPANRHLIVHNGRIRLTADPERHSCRPSVDVLFESIAREYPGAAAGCLLTGMGRDGAAGLLSLRRAGALTLAQDQATSVVYGMPREAALLGAAAEILPPNEIGRRLATLPTRTDPVSHP
jgi:two-component system, chemotaxis family, protein-glutamate methylesterase/glutaminase